MQAANAHAADGGEGVGGSGQAARADRTVSRAARSAASAICSSPSRRIRRCSSGSTATRTRKAKPQENFGRELMELFTRGVGYYTEDDVYAAARVFTGWNLQARRDDPRQRLVQLRLQREPARDERRRRSAFRSTATAAAPFRALGVGGHAGRHRSDRRAGDASGNRAAARDEAVRLLRQRDVDAGSSNFIDRLAVGISAERHAHQAGASSVCSRRAEFQAPSAHLLALLVAGGVRRPRDEGNGLDRLLARQHAVAADQHGAAAVRAAGRRGMGARPGDWFSTGAMLDAHELRGHARRQPEIQPGDGRRRARSRARRPCSITCCRG